MLDQLRVVDLSQPIGPDTVMWPGAPTPAMEPIARMGSDGYFSRKISFGEHTATHLDAPAHMLDGAMSVDRIAVDRLVRPLAVIDISEEIAGNPDGVLTLDHVAAFEGRYGRIADESAVFLRTGWEDFCADPARYANVPGELKFPGFGVEAARFLVEERRAAGLGTDTLGVDPGFAAEFPVHRKVAFPRDVWHIEGLVNLRGLPPLGAWVVVGALKLVGGSGSPARVLALVP